MPRLTALDFRLAAENTKRRNGLCTLRVSEVKVTYTPAAGRSHILPPQQPLLPFAMPHLPSLQHPPSLPQHDILPSLSLSLSFAIIGHFIPALLSLDIISSWDIMASLPSLDIWPHLPSLPQHDILPRAWSWLQQAQALGLSPDGAGAVWAAFWAIRPRAMTSALRTTSIFDFIVSSKFQDNRVGGTLA